MKLYMIYPAKADGVSASFEAIYCSSDASASRRASAVLSEHDSATKVSVWQGDRLVSSGGEPPRAAGEAGRS